MHAHTRTHARTRTHAHTPTHTRTHTHTTTATKGEKKKKGKKEKRERKTNKKQTSKNKNKNGFSLLCLIWKSVCCRVHLQSFVVVVSVVYTYFFLLDSDTREISKLHCTMLTADGKSAKVYFILQRTKWTRQKREGKMSRSTQADKQTPLDAISRNQAWRIL